MTNQKASTKHYRIRVEDRIFREGDVIVEAETAAEAALIAKSMANAGEVEMRFQYQQREPAIYRIGGVAELGDFPGTKPNDGCLTEHLEALLKLERRDPSMADELRDKYGEGESGYREC